MCGIDLGPADPGVSTSVERSYGLCALSTV